MVPVTGGDSSLFSAGAGLLVLGTVLAAGRRAGARAAGAVLRRCVSSLEVTSREPAYAWLSAWLSRLPLLSGAHCSPGVSESNAAGLSLVPSTGTHVVRWRGRWLRVERTRDASAAGNALETLRVSLISGSAEPLRAIVKEAHEAAADDARGRVRLYTPWAGDWRPWGAPRAPRPLSSVVLADGVAEGLLSDLLLFLGSSGWYAERGIPHRRGYLLHGPPGTGKTSLVHALASELGRPLCLLALADGTHTDERLQHLLASVPEGALVLVEDVDAATSSGRLSFSGLLNALDGAGAGEGRALFMTTNRREALDAALVRPGRVDVVRELGAVDSCQALRLFLRFYGGDNACSSTGGAVEDLARAFAERVARGRVSPAAVQGHFIAHRDDPAAAVRLWPGARDEGPVADRA